MAHIYKCDRCGKELDRQRNMWKVLYKVKYAKLFIHDEEYNRFEYDLCAACGKELLDWANGVKRAKK